MISSEELLAQARRRLYTAVISDTLDSVGLRHQAMHSGIRPLDEAVVLCGRARTGFYMQVFHVAPDANPYELEMRLVDDLKPGEVAVLGCGPIRTIAPWGELLSTASRARGAAGCVTDGMVRDVRAIRAMGFPVFHGGVSPLDSRGRGEVRAIDVPIECGGVRIEPGDLVFGDADGVVVIPAAVEREVLARALDKIDKEDTTRAELAAGARLSEVFRRHGVL